MERYRLKSVYYPVPGLHVRVRAIVSGDPTGRRVIFVHGTPGEAAGWARFLAHPLPGFEYVAIDRPGFGKTTPKQSIPSLSLQARAIEPLLVPRKGLSPLLVGHSLGGPIVAELAVRHPGRVGGLVIVAGSLDPEQEMINPLQLVGEWYGVRDLLPVRLRNANEELLPLKGELRRLAPRLPRLRCPITIIHGTRDPLVPYRNVTFMHRQFRHASPLAIVTLPGQNHFIPWDRQKVIEQAISDTHHMRGVTC